jgi:DNA-binding MarR family transcriptional regulator
MPADLPTPSSPRLRGALAANLRLLELADLLREHWTATARAHGRSGAQVKLLLGLGGDEAVTMRALAHRLRYDASNLTTLVVRLERDGLVERRPHASDGRATEVRLTAEGRRVRDAFWTALNARGPLDALDVDELATLDSALASALAAIRADAV